MLLEELKNDPIFAELIAEFVNQLPEKIAYLQAAFKEGDQETIRTISHQLKGAGGGYGFEEITNSASLVEMLSKTSNDADHATLATQIDRLASACEAARLSV